MNISIVGTGGVGGYFGGRLAKAGNNVTFIARGEHLKAIRNNGLIVKSISGDFTVKNANVTDKLTAAGSADLIIISTKAWQLKEIARELSGHIGNNTVILPLQNGVIAMDELSECIDSRHVIGGLCRIISKIESPGVINHFGVDPMIVFGERNNQKTERIARIREVLENAGIKARIADDIQSDLWKKFISICVSGLLAVTRSTYGQIREIKETRQMMIDLFTEIYQVSQKMNIQIESDFIEKTVAYIDSFPYDSSSSLARDVWEGRPSEIEYQNGTVVKLGEKCGVPTPINRFIYTCILPMELKARNAH